MEEKVLISFNESSNSVGNLVNFHQKSIKVHHSQQMRNFWQKVHEFTQNFLATFLELGSQDPPQFAGLVYSVHIITIPEWRMYIITMSDCKMYIVTIPEWKMYILTIPE